MKKKTKLLKLAVVVVLLTATLGWGRGGGNFFWKSE